MKKIWETMLFMEEHNCKRCKHYVKQNEGRTEALYGEIYGCEKWECEFEAKEIRK